MAQQQQISPDKKRIKTLDSLRGIAAMAVVMGHVTGGLPYMLLISFTPIYILKAGHEAVIFFFLLSGYVLVYQYGLTPKFEYRKFLIMRIFRLYIPYVVSVLISLVLILHCQKAHYDKEFLGELWHIPLNARDIVSHFILINDFNSNMLNPVIWSLVHEMRISLVFPLLLLLLRLSPFKAFIIAFAVAVIAAAGIVMIIYKYQAFGYLITYLATAHYFYIFIAGGLIAKYQDIVLNKLRNISRTKEVLMMITAFMLYCYAHAIPLAIANVIYIPGLVRGRFLIEDFLTTVASVYFVIAAISLSGRGTWLESRFPLFLGKISYSLYLIHLPLMLFIYYTLYSKMPIGYILIIGFVSAVAVSVIFNKLVEQQAVRLGKSVLAKLFKNSRHPRTVNTSG